jgi:hypothetical protein
MDSLRQVHLIYTQGWSRRRHKLEKVEIWVGKCPLVVIDFFLRRGCSKDLLFLTLFKCVHWLKSQNIAKNAENAENNQEM